jgi:DNA-binding MarR family transcriptional regulator
MRHDHSRGSCIVPFELEGVDELSSRVFRAFMRTLRLHRQLMIKTMAEHGAHPGQAMCLHLLEANEGITQRDLAEALHLARPTVSRMLRGMEAAGLVDRSPDARDQRLIHVDLTPAGRDLARELRVVAAAHVGETIGSLPERDRAELARLLEDLGTSMARAIEARTGPAEAPDDVEGATP